MIFKSIMDKRFLLKQFLGVYLEDPFLKVKFEIISNSNNNNNNNNNNIIIIIIIIIENSSSSPPFIYLFIFILDKMCL